MNKNEILKQIHNQLIVSCQARKGWPMYGADTMTKFALAAKMGGAQGIRANTPECVKIIKDHVDLPMIGIFKIFDPESQVYITPTYESAVEVINAGADIVAIDATFRKRQNNEKIESIVNKLKNNFPNILLMADVSSLEEAINAEKIGFDLVSTTLVGYTDETKEITNLSIDIVKEFSSTLKIPVIAEGHIETKEEAVACLQNGAFAVVVGTSITRPEIITQRYVDLIKKLHN